MYCIHVCVIDCVTYICTYICTCELVMPSPRWEDSDQEGRLEVFGRCSQSTRCLVLHYAARTVFCTVVELDVRLSAAWQKKPALTLTLTQTLPCPIIPYHTLPCPTLPYPTLPYLTLPYPYHPYPTLPYPTLP